MSEKPRLDQEKEFKVVTIGDSGAGKTSIIESLLGLEISGKIMTMGINFEVIRFTVNDFKLKLKIWDTAGQERYRSLSTSYYNNADGVLLVFDVSEKDCLANVENWLKLIQQNTPANSVLILVANKIDLREKSKTVSQEEVKQFASDQKLKYIETSAFTRTNIDELFKMLNKELILKSHWGIDTTNQTFQLQSKQLEEKTDKKKKCCK